MSNSRRTTNRGFDYDPKTDLSPRFIFWFTFTVFFAAWLFLSIWIIGSDISSPEILFDSNGDPLDYDAFNRYIMFGKQENSDFPIWLRVMVSLIFGGHFIYWMLRIQGEMWLLRKISRRTGGCLNK